ncbi:MAG: hypothetical protein GX895_07520, partial [Clostridiales bacterium]|nr:hypothetical protein [Clostridiales bacterium]
MNKLSILRIIFSILSLFLILTLSPFGIKNDDYNNKDLYRAVVLETLESDSTDTQKIKVLVEEGKFNGKEFNINNTLMLSDNLLTLKKNDKIVLLINEYEDGSLDITTYQYV